MKRVKIAYLSGWEDTIINVQNVFTNTNEKTFIIKAEDGLNMVFPRENIRYIHIQEENKEDVI